MTRVKNTHTAFEGIFNNISRLADNRTNADECNKRYLQIKNASNITSGYTHRRHTMPISVKKKPECGHELLNYSLRRTRGINTIPCTYGETIKSEAQIEFRRIKHSQQLDATNYVYLSAVHANFSLHQGLTLDIDGNLLLIKGKSKDLIKTSLMLLRNKTHFDIGTIKLEDNCQLRFSTLWVDAKGQLLGKVREQNCIYRINIEPSGLLQQSDINVDFLSSTQLSISFEKLNSEEERAKEMTFVSSDGRAISLLYIAGDLYLFSREPWGDNATDNYPIGKIALPLERGDKIVSASQIRECVKLEILRKDRKRLFYLSPRDIDTKTRRVKHLSHKPPQNLYAACGADPHERVFSGQPFDSIRWGNFSSRNLPLISASVDNFRANFKRARAHFHRDEEAKACQSILQGVDPGVASIARSIGQGAKTLLAPKRDIHFKTDLHQQFDRVDRFLQHGRVRNILSLAASHTPAGQALAEKIAQIIELLDSEDTVSFNRIKGGSCFFGLAAAGKPFVSGWFAGVLARCEQSFNLTFAKNDQDLIDCHFTKNDNRSFIALAGTGQGLEKTLLSSNTFSYGTVLPFEANLILVKNADRERSFKFSLHREHIEQFLFSLLNPDWVDTCRELNAKNTSLKISSNRGVTMLIEGKTELRVQAGFMANAATFMAAPRAAVGQSVALTFFDINKKRESLTTDLGGTNQKEGGVILSQHYLQPSISAFTESKVIPIPMMRVGEEGQKLLCFPLPLIEKLNQEVPITGNSLMRHLRLDGASLKSGTAPLIKAMDYYDDPPIAKAVEGEFQATDSHLRPELARLLPYLQQDEKTTIHAMDKLLSDLATNAMSYQVDKPGECLGDFVLSAGDYKTNLRLIKLGRPALLKVFPKDKPPRALWQRIRQVIKPWRRHTTLGEYLAVKGRQLSNEPGSDTPTGRGVWRYIDAIERYADRTNRDSLDKSSQVRASATYRLQPHTIEELRRRICQLSQWLLAERMAGRSGDRHFAQLTYLQAIFEETRYPKNALFQLDTISLFRQGCIKTQAGTLPLTLFSLTNRHELNLSSSLGTLKFAYRQHELFPYRLETQLKILADLDVENDERALANCDAKVGSSVFG